MASYLSVSPLLSPFPSPSPSVPANPFPPSLPHPTSSCHSGLRLSPSPPASGLPFTALPALVVFVHDAEGTFLSLCIDHLQVHVQCSPAGKHRSQILSFPQPTSGLGTGVRHTAPAGDDALLDQPDQPRLCIQTCKCRAPVLSFFLRPLPCHHSHPN